MSIESSFAYAPMPQQPPNTRGSGSRGLVIAIIVSAVLVVITIAAISTVAIMNQLRSPEATAARYFAALSAGDASTANALTRSPEADSVTLTDEMLHAADERISDVSVASSSDSDSARTAPTVEVQYTLAGERYTGEVTLTPGPKEWGVLRTWQVRDPYASSIVFSRDGARPGTIAVADVPLEGPFPSAELYPAVYPFGIVGTPYVTTDSDHLTVTGPDADPMPSVTIVTTPEFDDELQRRSNALLDECAAETTPQVSSCDLYARGVPNDTAGTWTIDQYPVAADELDGALYRSDGGRAIFTPATGDPVRVDVSFFGKVEIDGESLRLVPWAEQ